VRLFICGSRQLGDQVMSAAVRHEHEIVGVCAPDGDRMIVKAVGLGVAPVTPSKLTPTCVPECDVILAAGCTWYLPMETRDRARLGVLAYHPSLLPIHRGGDAVRWAIHLRERVTGGTLYWMTDRVDAGPIVMQDHVLIRPHEDAKALWARALLPIGVRFFDGAMALWAAGKGLPPAIAQDETLATWEPAFSRPALRPT
jgi:methionyl-tRNA formyltransferase